ncbi:uncharacterized protein LOC107874226 [Capsicum annuum]|uniref:uncharacterized protein LOC107874226 n=1 Tax=Capsicum annuum TaxID=4072 RepID=UPI001FB14E16|nr:uncharacterized protein LOC107874226 [Capsicum annuum]
MRQQQSIHVSFEKQSNKDKYGCRIRLVASIDVARLLVRQGLVFRDHDESKSSLNRDIFNVLGSSYKRMDKYKESQKIKIQEDFDMGELKTSKGLHQALGISRACDTRWGSHVISFDSFILKFDTIMDILDNIVETAHSLDERSRATGLEMLKPKIKLQELREDNKLDLFVSEVSTFCIKHNIAVPAFDKLYVNSGRSQHKHVDYTFFHHYRVEVFCKVIDWQLQELNDRFDEVTTELFHGVACLNPVDSFLSFNIQKIMRMVELYHDDFDELNMCALKNQLTNYIIDVRDIDKRFSNLNGLGYLSKRLVQIKKHCCYPLVFRLVKIELLLPVATASIERAFSAIKFIKNELRSRMNDDFLSGCMTPFVEKDVFNNISTDDIILSFQAMKPRRVIL